MVSSNQNPNFDRCAQDVFVLGAGFSKAIHSGMPLLSELAELLGEALPPHSLAEVPFLSKDFELGLTYLAEGHPGLSEPRRLRNRALLIEITQHLTEILVAHCDAATSSSKCPWLLPFAHFLHERRSVVITLNYDTLLEWALSRIIIGGGGYLDIRSVLGIELQSSAGQLGVFETPTALLLKLHGSTNWYYSGSESYYGEPIYDRRLPGRVPLILPPVASKNLYFNNELLRGQWSLAARALAAAERIFCLGYSLPSTDLTIRFLLQTSGNENRYAGNQTKRIPVYVVDRDRSRIQHYRDHLPDWLTAEAEFCGDDDCIPRLVSRLESELIALPSQVDFEESADSYCCEIVKAGIRLGDTLRITWREEITSVLIELYDRHGIVIRDAEGVACRVPWRCFDFSLRRVSEERREGRPFPCHVDQLASALGRYYPSRNVAKVVVSLLERLGRLRKPEQMESSLRSSYVELPTEVAPHRDA